MPAQIRRSPALVRAIWVSVSDSLSNTTLPHHRNFICEVDSTVFACRNMLGIQSNDSIGARTPRIPTLCPSCPTPLKYSGSLDHLDYFEITPIIGREYPTVQVTDVLNAPNAEDQIRDLAIIISERGVVFFRDQEDLSIVDQKKFCDLLGKLSGRPEDHGLHVHPIYRDPGNLTLPDGTTDVSGSSFPGIKSQ